MVEINPDMYGAARILSTAINPLLVLLWIGAVAFGWRWRVSGLGRFAIASIVAVLVTYFAVHAFRWLKIWQGHPEFPSGHETFAASIATSLALWDARWLFVGLPLLAILGIALVEARYHDPMDIIGAIIMSPPVAWICQEILGKPRLSAAR